LMWSRKRKDLGKWSGSLIDRLRPSMRLIKSSWCWLNIRRGRKMMVVVRDERIKLTKNY
jgi:hypothetical protein